MENRTAEKIGYLDGLRGIAALMVVIGHFIQQFFPEFYGPDPAYFSISAISLKINYLILLYPITNPFPVPIFFVLSGYVLTYKYFRTNDPEKKKDVYMGGAVKRYPRLMIPSLISIIIAFFLLYFGLSHHGIMIDSPDLTEALRQGLYNAYFTYNSGPSANVITYNGVLWTMYHEFTGSMIVFAFLALFGESKYRRYFYIPLIAYFIGTYLIGFIIGLIISDLYNDPMITQNKKYKLAIPTIFMAMGTLLSIPVLLMNYTIPGMDLKLMIIYLLVGFIMTMLLSLSSLQWLLSRRPLLFLGKISFSMYLIHGIILSFFSFFLITTLSSYTNHIVAIMLTLLISLPVIFGLSYVYYRSIDTFSMNLSKHLYNRVKGSYNEKNIIRIDKVPILTVRK